jgi:hypothetical protein
MNYMSCWNIFTTCFFAFVIFATLYHYGLYFSAIGEFFINNVTEEKVSPNATRNTGTNFTGGSGNTSEYQYDY